MLLMNPLVTELELAAAQGTEKVKIGECRQFIDKGCRSFDTIGAELYELIDKAISQYGMECVSYVVAKTIQMRECDPNISEEHVCWAKRDYDKAGDSAGALYPVIRSPGYLIDAMAGHLLCGDKALDKVG